MKVLHEESLNDWSLDMLRGGSGSKDCTMDICSSDTCTDNVCTGKICDVNYCTGEMCSGRTQCNPKKIEPPIEPCSQNLCDPHAL